jgi:hypothetical protein
MADPTRTQAQIDAEAAKQRQADTKDTQTVDLHNPTRARRIIHDGINEKGKAQKSITVEPGETKRNVVLHKDIIKELKDRTRPRGKDKADLIVLSPGAKPPGQDGVSDEDDA